MYKEGEWMEYQYVPHCTLTLILLQLDAICCFSLLSLPFSSEGKLKVAVVIGLFVAGK